MKRLKHLTRQAFILIVSEVLFVGLLSYGVNQYIFPFMQEWTWWQYLLMILGFAVLVTITLIVWQLLSNYKVKRRNLRLARQVGDFQLSVMQDFFKIRMQQSYGGNWIIQVKNVSSDRGILSKLRLRHI